jgi:hypothetical protein
MLCMRSDAKCFTSAAAVLERNTAVIGRYHRAGRMTEIDSSAYYCRDILKKNTKNSL